MQHALNVPGCKQEISVAMHQCTGREPTFLSCGNLLTFKYMAAAKEEEKISSYTRFQEIRETETI